ncbi:unannotated protein [freshwater metagenome]|uniref:Unannotated protein n=1 Tax=freshwater metagenome TaxID=449393 RepID=A0A6J6DHP0_9ZZZZ
MGIENPIPVVDTNKPSALGMYSVAGTVDPSFAVRFTGSVTELASLGFKPNEFIRYAEGKNMRKFARFNSLTPFTGALKCGPAIFNCAAPVKRSVEARPNTDASVSTHPPWLEASKMFTKQLLVGSILLHSASAASGGTIALRIAGSRSMEILLLTVEVETSPIVQLSIAITHPRHRPLDAECTTVVRALIVATSRRPGAAGTNDCKEPFTITVFTADVLWAFKRRRKFTSTFVIDI